MTSEEVTRCGFCHEALALPAEVSAARAVAASASTSTDSFKSSTTIPPQNKSAAPPEDWRREIVSRVQAYRERRNHLLPGDSQAGLPFRQTDQEEDEAAPELEESPRHAPLLASLGAESELYRSLPLRSPRAHGVERVEIAVTQPELNFEAQEPRPSVATADAGAVIPVAPLAGRRHAALIDTLFLLLAYAGFLGMFHAFGGRLTLGKSDLIVMGVALALFYAQYFALFTVFGGETPGMSLCKLRVVAFDGSVPTARQLLWRSFGYLVSGGTAFLGFLWALWDEDHLTWQDRISQTYLTNVPAPQRAEETESDLEGAGFSADESGVHWRRTTP